MRGRTEILASALMLLMGCTVTSNSSSPKDIKKALLRTEVLKSAGYLFPGDQIPPGPVYYRTPSAKGKRHFRQLIEKLAVPLLAIQRSLAASRLELLPTARTIDHRKVENLEIDLVEEGTSIARIDSEGRLSLDLRVMHAVWVASVLEMPASWMTGLSSMEVFAEPEAESEEIVVPVNAAGIPREAIVRAIGRAQTIRNGKTPPLIRDIFADDPVVFDYHHQLSVVGHWETTFIGTLRYLLAHEMGHIALSHFDWLEGLQAEVEAGEMPAEDFCHQRQMAEVESDFYAVILLRELNANVIEKRKAGGGFSELFGGFNIQSHAGFYSFLESAYQYAGFDDHLASGECSSHPPTHFRVFAADLIFQAFVSDDPEVTLGLVMERFDEILGEGWMEEEGETP